MKTKVKDKSNSFQNVTVITDKTKNLNYYNKDISEVLERNNHNNNINM